jgi:dienelactone hydrolase
MMFPFLHQRAAVWTRRWAATGGTTLWLLCLQSTSALRAEEAWPRNRIRAILEAPTRAELEAIRASWENETTAGTDVHVVERGRLEREGKSFQVHTYRYTVEGHAQYTAVFAPVGARPKSLPILVETRGVSFDYPTRRITDGPFVMSVIGDLVDDFVIVEPCLRGHELQAIKAVHRAGGDRRDSWEGATRDVMVALSVVSSVVPAADAERVVSFGLSRGGTVALLHGIRDKRVRAVVAMSAPADWLRLMARPEDDWAARIHQAAVSYDGPADDRAVQFYEWFLQDRAHVPDTELRRRLIASSPLHFAESLPPTLVHQGTEDSSVPSVNATALRARFGESGFPEATHQVNVHQGAGHLLKDSAVAEQTQVFLRRYVLTPAQP